MDKKQPTVNIRYFILERSVRNLAERGIVFRPLPYSDYNTPISREELARSQQANEQVAGR